MTAIPVFDGHNDTILSLRTTGRSFFEESPIGHVDLPRARKGGLAGGIFSIWVPDEPEYSSAAESPEVGMRYALESLSALAGIERESNGEVAISRTTSDIRQNLERGVFSIVLHFEGAEPIDSGLSTLEAYYLAGIRSIGLAWSRPNAFAYGVPMDFPGSPDIGAGLTDAGKALVAACDELGILIDLSHLNEAGFWDVSRLSRHPLVCSHSAVHAICPSPRNLTDKQIDAIQESGGFVGVNFHTGYLRPDGSSDAATTTIAHIADHVDYLCERIGPEHVGFGSDFDGATMPADLRDAAGLPKLISELSRRGYDDATLHGLAFENWLRVLDRIWHA